jgi:hypothetical protein
MAVRKHTLRPSVESPTWGDLQKLALAEIQEALAAGEMGNCADDQGDWNM